jgi:prophage antirepressor-like protein
MRKVQRQKMNTPQQTHPEKNGKYQQSVRLLSEKNMYSFFIK